ncbi:MAG: peptidoglycan-binding protein [Candidatus Liptonbacteria bacterium]|nr:peptidoglycan-binding protein [Candidatus Liptonbacteria bacterium]
MSDKKLLVQALQLLPPHLGPKAEGVAVVSVQITLVTLGLLDPDFLTGEEAGCWGEKTIEAVKRLQRALGFQDEEVNGCFDEKTRERLAARLFFVSDNPDGEEFHLDLRRLGSAQSGRTTWFELGKPDEPKQWPVQMDALNSSKSLGSKPKVVPKADTPRKFIPKPH